MLVACTAKFKPRETHSERIHFPSIHIYGISDMMSMCVLSLWHLTEGTPTDHENGGTWFLFTALKGLFWDQKKKVIHLIFKDLGSLFTRDCAVSVRASSPRHIPMADAT